MADHSEPPLPLRGTAARKTPTALLLGAPYVCRPQDKHWGSDRVPKDGPGARTPGPPHMSRIWKGVCVDGLAAVRSR